MDDSFQKFIHTQCPLVHIQQNLLPAENVFHHSLYIVFKYGIDHNTSLFFVVNCFEVIDNWARVI